MLPLYTRLYHTSCKFQVYYGVKWQAKFKSPTRHCFAIKHPQIQAKNPKYIRYLAADSEQELNKWVTGIRVAKYGKTIYENYRFCIFSFKTKLS